jgi:hypothetical protein
LSLPLSPEWKKPNCPIGDLEDVTLGSPAVLPNRALQTRVEQIRPVAFRPHLTVGLALSDLLFVAIVLIHILFL